jgi:hypothetical protein
MKDAHLHRDAYSGEARAWRRVEWAIVLTVLLCAVYVLPRWADPNQNSRLDMVVAVVDDGTFRIDPYVANTVDYAKVDGHYYSDKAPGAAFLGIGLYAAVRPVLDSPFVAGLSDRLAQHEAFRTTLRADGSGVNAGKVRFALLQTLVAALVAALPTALACLLVWRLALRFSGSAPASLVAAFAYALATPALAYSNAVYGHQLAAFLLVAAFALVALGPPRPGTWRLLLVGVLLAFAIVTEYPTLPAAGILFGYTGWRLLKTGAPLRLGWTLAAGLAVGAGWMAYNTVVFGGPLSLGYSYSELWMDQHSVGFMSLSTPTWAAAWGITFSPFRGLFLLAPWLLLALPGYVLWWRRAALRAAWWAVLGCAAALFAFNVSSHMWWGGFAVGPRYLLPALPFLALPAAFALDWLLQRGMGRALAALLLLGSWVAVWGMSLAGQAYPSDALRNPWLEYALPRWAVGDLARSLGTIAGLPGFWGLLPLLLVAGLGVALGATGLGLAHGQTDADPLRGTEPPRLAESGRAS